MPTLVVPLPLPQLNDVLREAKAHFGAYARPKKQLTQAIAWLAKEQGVTPVAGPVSIIMEWHPANRRVDPDNLSHGFKYLADGLVLAGILLGDGYKHIREIHHVFGAIDKLVPHVEVEIKPVVSGGLP